MAAIAVRGFRVFGNLVQKAGPICCSRSCCIARAITRAHKEMVCTAVSWDIASVWRGRHRQRDALETLAMTPLV